MRVDFRDLDIAPPEEPKCSHCLKYITGPLLNVFICAGSKTYIINYDGEIFRSSCDYGLYIEHIASGIILHCCGEFK